MRRKTYAILICILAIARAAQTADLDVAGFLEKTATKNGLCLVLGARDMALASSLSAKSQLYVQVLQPDAKLGQQWGLEIAASAQRENLGVREGAFDPENYGSDLFNLIVVEDPASIGKATLADLDRMLVPAGVVAFKVNAEAVVASAKSLDMTAVETPSFAAAFRKAVKERAPMPADNLKWRAGTRAHWSGGWKNHGSANGVFYYSEKLEVPADPKGGRWLLNVRDAYNGRLLWTMEGSRVIGSSHDGRLFVLNAEGKLVSCEARTGVVQYEFPSEEFTKHVGYALAVGDDQIILIGNDIRSYATNGKKLWEGRLFGPSPSALAKDRIFLTSYYNPTLRALNVKDGKQLWESAPLPGKEGHILLSEKFVHVNVAGWLVTLDPETGKELWRYQQPALPSREWVSNVLTMNDKIMWMRYAPYAKEDSDLFITTLDSATGKVESQDVGTKRQNRTNMCAPWAQRAGDYIFYFFGIWVDPKTMKSEFPYFAHPSCGFGTYLSNAMAYNFPSRKPGPLQGISAIAPSDLVFDHEPGGKAFQKYADGPQNSEDVKADDWIMFRATPSRSNSTKAAPGEKLVKLWETNLGPSTRTFGQMCSIRSGLTQAVSAYGLAIVADMDGQRIVALDAETGKEKWTFAVGSRVEFSPTLYKGLCLFTAKDGWVYCLDAKTGTLCWKRLIPSRVRLIGGQDKLESLWPVTSDVMIENGIGYACAGINSSLLGGVRAIAFHPETGELVWSQCYSEAGVAGLFVGTGDVNKVLMHSSLINAKTGKREGDRPHWWVGSLVVNNPMDDYLAGGVSVPRNGEDRAGVQMSNGILAAKTLSFDDSLSVGYQGTISQEQWEKGFTSLYAKTKGAKDNAWKVEDDLIVDDIVLSPGVAYVVGHHYREAKPPELRVISRQDGKTLASHELNTAFPAWNGMSVAGDRIFIATGEGKLICFKGEK